MPQLWHIDVCRSMWLVSVLAKGSRLEPFVVMGGHWCDHCGTLMLAGLVVDECFRLEQLWSWGPLVLPLWHTDVGRYG